MAMGMRARWLAASSCLALLALLAACVAEGPGDLCRQAADHLEACTGVEDPTAGGAACGGEAVRFAEQVLTTSCDELQGDGKTDALSSPLGTAVCVALAIPLFMTGVEDGGACCFGYNCAGANTCRAFTCQPKSALGGPCVHGLHCESDLVCVNRRCAPPRQEGETCGAPGACAAGLVCAPAGRCVAPRPLGADCGRADQVCDALLLCDPATGTCQEPPASGAACDRAEPFPCQFNETCWDGRCELRHGTGAPCADMFDCKFGLFCNDGACGPM